MEYKIPNFYQAMPQCSRLGHQENIVYFCVNEQCPKKFEELCVQCLNKRETSHKHSEYLLIENAYNFLSDLYNRQQNKIDQQACFQEAFESIKTLKFKILEIFENMENQIAQLKDRFDSQYHLYRVYKSLLLIIVSFNAYISIQIKFTLQQLFKQNFVNKQNKKRFFVQELKQLIQEFNKYVHYNFEKSGIHTIIVKEFSDYLDDVQKMNFSEALQDIENLIQCTKSLNIIKHQQLKVQLLYKKFCQNRYIKYINLDEKEFQYEIYLYMVLSINLIIILNKQVNKKYNIILKIKLASTVLDIIKQQKILIGTQQIQIIIYQLSLFIQSIKITQFYILLLGNTSIRTLQYIDSKKKQLIRQLSQPKSQSDLVQLV